MGLDWAVVRLTLNSAESLEISNYGKRYNVKLANARVHALPIGATEEHQDCGFMNFGDAHQLRGLNRPVQKFIL